MIDPSVLKALVAAGATPEMIVAAVEAAQASEEIRRAASREKNRLRQKRYRQGHPGKEVEDVTTVTRDRRYKTLQTVSNGDSVRDTSSLTSSFFLVDQPLKEESKEVRSELVALETRDVARVISDDWPDDYEAQFWAAYPRKIGRKAARAKLRLIRQRKEVTFAALMAGVARMPIGEAKFIPHPTSWLNQGRWEDEHIPQGIQHGPPTGNIIPAADRLVAKFAEFDRVPDAEVRSGEGASNVRLLSEGRR